MGAQSHRTLELLAQIDAAHDWRAGQTYGGNGTHLSSMDVCRIYGLQRNWCNDRQNGNMSEITYERGGQVLSLRDAAKGVC